jgi:hypothetical protein
MAGILVDLQDAIVQFVRQRVQADKWKDLTTSCSILRELERDDGELKEYFWTELLYAVRWSDVLHDVEQLAIRNQELQGEEEADCSQQSSDEEDDDEEASSLPR